MHHLNYEEGGEGANRAYTLKQSRTSDDRRQATHGVCIDHATSFDCTQE